MSTISRHSRIAVTVLLLLAVTLVVVRLGTVSAAANVTPASGGGAISADTAAAGGSGAWTDLGAITIAEALATDFAASQTNNTLVLNAPAGFEFNAARATDVASTGADVTAVSLGVAAGAITVTFSTDATADTVDSITVGGVTSIQVRPTAGTPLASGNILRDAASSSSIVGVDGSTNFGTLTEVAGAAAALAVTTQPAGATAGAAFGTQPVVRTEDQFGNPSTAGLGASLNVTATIATGSGPLQGTTALDIGTGAGNGVVTYTDLRIDVAQAGVTLDFAAGGLTTATSGAFNVAAANASALRMVTQPAGATAGAAFGTQPVVQAIDAFGNDTAAGLPANASAALASGVGPLLGTLSVAFDGGGQVAFADLQLDTAQAGVTLDFTATGLTKVTSAAFTVSASGAVALQLSVQPANAIAGAPFGVQPALVTVDGFGNPSTAGLPASLTVTATLTAGTGPLLGDTTEDIGTAAGNGAVSFGNLRLDTLQGDAVITFSAAGLTAAASQVILVEAAAPSPSMSVVTLLPGRFPTMDPGAVTVFVTLRDSFGNPTAGDVAVTSTVGTVGEVVDLNGGAYRVFITDDGLGGTGTVEVSVNGQPIRELSIAFATPDGGFSLPLSPGGATLVVYGGGTVDELLAQLTASGAVSAAATVDGVVITLIPTELEFVNEAFRDAFTPLIPAGTILWIRLDG